MQVRSGDAALDTIFDSIHDAIALLDPVRDPEGRLTGFNVGWADAAWRDLPWLGLRAMAGDAPSGLTPSPTMDMAVFERVLATGAPLRLDHPAPDDRWVDATFSRLGSQLLVVARDITERRRAEAQLAETEARLATVLSTMSESIIVMRPVRDADGVLLDHVLEWANDAWFRRYGLGPEAVGRGVFELSPHHRTLIPVHERVLATGEPEHLDFALPDGRWIAITFHRFGTSLMAVAHDITARKRREAELRAAEERVHAAERAEMVARLAGGVAHDYNNILAGISGFAGFLADSLAPDDDRHQDAIRIGEAAAKATVLTRQLLAYSRHEVLQPVELDPAEVVRGVLPLARSACGGAVDVRFVEGDPACVRVDRRVLEEALINLILNAGDAMPCGGRVTIATRITGDEVAISVADTGSGIPPEHQPHVFEPFYTTKELATGSGLGLASVEGAIAQSGGRVTLRSTVGAGSTFTILLPVVVPVAPEAAPADAAAAGAAGSGTVLLVDDEQLVRVVVSRMLQALGYEVVIADRPAVALAIVEAGTTPFDAVLTDMLMPGMTGVELVERIRAVRPAVPVALMSGFSPDTAFADGLVPEGMPFLSKPFAQEALAAAMNAILGTPLPECGAAVSPAPAGTR